MVLITDKEVLIKYHKEIENQVKGRDGNFDSGSLADLNTLRALRGSNGWRGAGREELRQELLRKIDAISSKLKALDHPTAPSQPQVTQPHGVEPLDSNNPTQPSPQNAQNQQQAQKPNQAPPNGVTIFTSTDRNSYYGDYLLDSYRTAMRNGQRSISSIQESATKMAAGNSQSFPLSNKETKENLDSGGNLHPGKNFNHPQAIGPFAHNAPDRLGPDTELVILVGDTEKKDARDRFTSEARRFAREARKTGAHVTILESPTEEGLDKSMKALQARITSQGRKNFWVIASGHGSSEKVSTTGLWAIDHEGSIQIRGSLYHEKTAFDIKESDFIDRLNEIQKATGAHAFFTAYSCASGAWLAKQ